MNLDNISADEARQLFAYDPNTGVITRRFSAGGCPSGSVAGWINSEGYVSLRLFGKSCKAHRFAWLLHYGVWPSKQIDHINGVRHDNRILNLREASRAENAWNRQTQTNNASGYKGVSWHRSSRKWVAQIRGNGTKKHIGLFDTPAEAHAAYRAAAINYHGEFANDGRADMTNPKHTSSDLVDRLRWVSEWYFVDPVDGTAYASDDPLDAADRIEELEARYEKSQDQIDRLIAENERIRERLGWICAVMDLDDAVSLQWVYTELEALRGLGEKQ